MRSSIQSGHDAPSLGVGGLVPRLNGGSPLGTKHWNIHMNRREMKWTRPRRTLPKCKCQFFVLTPRAKLMLTAVPWHGIHLDAVYARSAVGPGHDTAILVWDRPSMAIKKKQVQKTDVAHLAAVETTLFNEHMSLVEHMALRKYDDGSDREPGWITIKVSGAAWVVQVKDPDSCQSFSAVGDTLDKAIGTASLLLACEEAPWEPDAWLSAAKSKKKK